jgi:hypothetical protein
MTTLEICERIAALDAERRGLEADLIGLTGKGYDEHIEGMRRLFTPGAMSIRIGDGPAMSVDEFLEGER